jgi:hypothetical protein
MGVADLMRVECHSSIDVDLMRRCEDAIEVSATDVHKMGGYGAEKFGALGYFESI